VADPADGHRRNFFGTPGPDDRQSGIAENNPGLQHHRNFGGLDRDGLHFGQCHFCADLGQARRYDRPEKVYVLGFTIFIFGSVLAGLSWNLSSMIVFRIIQAIASSADYPTAMAIIAFTFKEGRERAQALGIWSSSFAAASVFGPLIGGPLIDNFGWRSVFLVNLPVGVIGLFMALAFISESVSEKKSRVFDWWGAITLGASLSSLVLVLDQGLSWGWLAWNSDLCYLTMFVFAFIFIRIEKNHPEPIVDLKFFKIPAFVNTLANNFIVFMGMIGAVFLIPIFAQVFWVMTRRRPVTCSFRWPLCSSWRRRSAAI